MKYIENPKTKGSGIICAIPQKGLCPNKCEDCFFQSGRSYLKPLKENLPNMPSMIYSINRIVRVNDGNDSNIQRKLVIKTTEKYTYKFYNTAIPRDLGGFKAPVVLTVNPGDMTDLNFHKLNPIPKNLMFVRARVNTWNLNLIDDIVYYYTSKNIPVILTFMAYYTTKTKKGFEKDYVFRKRTLNSYNAITTNAWEKVMARYKYNTYVYSCSKIEGEKGNFKCERCGNCIREYFNCLVKIENK